MTSGEPAIPWVAVGRVTRAHGVHGEVAVLSLTDVAERFEEVPDRTAADALSGSYLFVPGASSPTLSDGEFWPHQIVGAEVRTESGRSLGRIVEIVRTPANDVWVARGDEGESLIPALRDLVLSVDVAAGRVMVREVPGLTVPENP